ncbi:MAG TPA: glycosyltransferase, partial [Thermoanaerobaculia bacterium]|nr:glycosyltransferase [Thermoanaerobaculia bacterium]
ELARHGSVTLISDSLPEDIPWASTQRASMPDLRALRRFRHVPDELLFARAARRALFDVHRRTPIDFVLAHSHAVTHLASRSFREATGVKCGFFVHGDINDRPEGTYDRRLTAFYRWVAPRGYRAADVVFALAKPFEEMAKRDGARRVEIIPNGIDPEEIGITNTLSQAERRQGEELRVLTIARLSIEKGLTHLIDAFTQLPNNITLDILGKGPLEETLHNAIAKHNLESRVRLLGTLPRLELGATYRAHHVFCTPALSEPFALVIIEALASGLPVIGTIVGGIPDVVVDEHNGLLVPPADASALAAAILRLANDEPLRLALASHARDSVLPRLRWTLIGDRLAAVIRMLA